jgi:hypothetical protein
MRRIAASRHARDLRRGRSKQKPESQARAGSSRPRKAPAATPPRSGWLRRFSHMVKSKIIHGVIGPARKLLLRSDILFFNGL